MPYPTNDQLTHSLRTRLLLLLLAAVAIFALAQGATAYTSALQQADDLFDLHLQQMARSLRARLPEALSWQGDGVADDADEQLDLLVQIWGADGAPVFRSPRSLLPQTAVLGFSDVHVDGHAYRVYAVQTPLQTIQIAQDMGERNAHARALAWRAALPAALLAPLLMLVVWWVVSRSLAPLERTRRQVAARAADDLSPLADAELPYEVRPLVQELNLLFGRVHSAFAAQKSFVADAAHELRSPLAALKLQAQVLQRTQGLTGAPGATNAASTAPDVAVTRLSQGIDRAIALVEQLLALARAEAGNEGPVGEESGTPSVVDLRHVIRLAVADVLPQAHAAGVDLGAETTAGTTPDATAEAPVNVRGDAEALRILLRNLLDNAIKYSTPPGRVDVALRVTGDQACLSVDDNGPGIPVAEQGRVFDRFYRAEGARQTRAGSGLGLAIVRVIAERHRATVRLATSPQLGGLRVEVRLPLDTSLAG